MIICPKCGAQVRVWTPYRVDGRLHIWWTCCGLRWRARADFIPTEIQEIGSAGVKIDQ